MKKIVVSLSALILLLTLVGCGSKTEKAADVKESEKVETTSSSSSKESIKQNIETSTQQSLLQTESSAPAGQMAKAEFDELLSGIEYNKEYLTEDQVSEFKEMYKEEMSEEQYQGMLKVLE